MKWRVVPIFLMATGCAVPVPPGTTDQSKFTVATVQAAARISVLENLPLGAKSIGPVEDTACQRFQWDPIPTEETALILLKAKAASMGANAVVGVTYRHHNVSLGKNCFGNIVASGTAAIVPTAAGVGG